MLFNVVSLESGKIRKRINAASFDEAVNVASDLLNCYVLDDYIIETPAQTEAHREAQSRWWSLQTIDNQF